MCHGMVKVMIDDYHHIAWGVAQLRTHTRRWHAPLHRVTKRRAPERTRPPGGWDGTTRRRTGDARHAAALTTRARCGLTRSPSATLVPTKSSPTVKRQTIPTNAMSGTNMLLTHQPGFQAFTLDLEIQLGVSPRCPRRVQQCLRVQ